MNSGGIRWAALGVLGVSFLGFFFGGGLPLTLTAKFFLGAFGFGTGVVLLIVSKILRIKEYENRENATDPEAQEAQEDDENQDDEE